MIWVGDEANADDENFHSDYHEVHDDQDDGVDHDDDDLLGLQEESSMRNV